jgi:uncharacterized protein (TIGR03435 family)
MSVIKITHAAALLLLAACGVFAAQAPAFDVASIRANTSNDGIQELQMRPGGRLMISGMPLRDLIKRAYGADAIQTLGQIVGGPAWAGIDRFDILAATDSDVDSDPKARPSRMLTMLRTLLEDRFKLHVHQETREAEAFALVVASKDGKTGPDLRRSTIDCPVFIPGAPRPPPDPVRWCGFRGPRNGTLTAQGVTMKELATMLAGFLAIGRPVLNRTALDGTFDFHIPFEPGFVFGPNPGSPLVPGAAADSAPNFFTAIQEQLGLKLQSERAPVDFVVIDHAERPTEN